MERENIITATAGRLKQFGLGELSYYKENTQEQFFTIEQYFLEKEERLKEILEEIKSTNFNIRGICKDTNISKSTVYNNPNTIRLYIEKRIKDIETQDLLFKNKQEKSQERITEIEDFLDKAIIDQIEYNNLKVHNGHLQVELNRFSEKCELLGAERLELVKRLNAAEIELRQLRNKKGNVVTLNEEKV
ncbi:hypothetical protein [Solibacillus isronensis]|uniref:hypothetical protein n=1 Tax=Solibacillus isronensis TaxID=412383 RepID=UPI0009A58194|nr:hypothetical protein [Solibacillus isronensis]